MTGFQERHIGTDDAAQKAMLAVVGYDSVEALVTAAVPPAIHVKPIENSVIPDPASERSALRELRALAAKNTVNRSMIGLGYYDTVTPAVIKRNVQVLNDVAVLRDRVVRPASRLIPRGATVVIAESVEVTAGPGRVVRPGLVQGLPVVAAVAPGGAAAGAGGAAQMVDA